MGKTVAGWETVFNNMSNTDLDNTIKCIDLLPNEIYEEFESLGVVLNIAKTVKKFSKR